MIRLTAATASVVPLTMLLLLACVPQQTKDATRNPARFLSDGHGLRWVCRAKFQYTRGPSRDSGAEV
jgi:hypothetical protein